MLKEVDDGVETEAIDQLQNVFLDQAEETSGQVRKFKVLNGIFFTAGESGEIVTSANAEAEAEAFNGFLTVLLEETRDKNNLPLEEVEAEAQERNPEEAETENSTSLDQVNGNNTDGPVENTGNGNEKKKRTRRGTRGKGRKINYKKFQDNKAAEAIERPPEDAETMNSTPLAEQNGGRKELMDAKASRDQHKRQTQRKPQTQSHVWTHRDGACESGWRGPAHWDRRDRRIPRRSTQDTPSHAGA
ncbi:uncharacterized protein LOC128317250 [Pangasianodon hypophthalmus]|uniref:uncharacterized protein LOC128317250 n=1 Tax=Pangasianodon hypophthalmus TaxID=310915 RepID=UPI0023078AA9|nr:uncharacterized protein LOC128317250 [Pangasianodon hypophthalmus]